jgi:drug/metabolite transporter (DMT)-like permease
MDRPSDIPARYAYYALILASLCLAAGPWMVRLADVGPVADGFWRLAIALPWLISLALGASAGRPLPPFALVAACALGGLFFAIDLAAWHEGILRTRLANATLFGNMSSFMFALYGFVMLRALPRPMQGFALLLAVAGTVLLLGRSYELSATNFTGDLLCLLAAFFYALYLIIVDQARKAMRSWAVLAIATAAGVFPLLGAALLLGETVMPNDWTPVILLSFGSQLVGQGLLVYAMGHLPVVVIAVGLLIQPVASAAIGWAVYGERLTLLDWVGGLLICAAMVLIRLPDVNLATSPAEAH